MVSLSVTERSLPMADPGPTNPLPPFADTRTFAADLATAGFPAEIAANIGYGTPRSIYPYLLRDGYTRERTPGTLRMAVLENAHLRAEFALGLGGRLWSLTDQGSGRDLLFTNPVLQPANLALRNAWFAGGVEWNIGTRGHTPTTCEPLHAAVVTGPHGGEALRMWEFERLRGVVFQIDAWLPDDSPALLVQVRIRNHHDRVVPMYWWSNTAVRERPDLRVLTPADHAYHIGYDGTLTIEPTVDAPWSYPASCDYAADYFFDVPPGRRPWIAALTGDGHGLVQTSTARLRGRKLFVWGQNRGGRRWANWLTDPNAPGGYDGYVEVQAGLAATQYEHLRMPAGAEWRWVEAYAPLSADPGVTHGADHVAAVAQVAARLEEVVPQGHLDSAYAAAAETMDRPPLRLLQSGSGWGALEQASATADGEPFPDVTGTPFPAVDSAECRPWQALLDTGVLPDAAPSEPPASYALGDGWERRLEAAPRTWSTAYHLAVLAHARGDVGVARALYVDSLDRVRTAWACRGLALLDSAGDTGGRDGEAGGANGAVGGDSADRARLLVEAHDLAPDCWQLTVEALAALADAGLHVDALALLDRLPAGQRTHGRVRVREALAAHAAGDLDRAHRVLSDGLEVADLREGEVSLTSLWETVFPGEPLPAMFDFRMQAER